MPEEQTFSNNLPDAIARLCPRQKATPKPLHWVEIELVGEDGKPLAGEEYRIILPCGKVVRGYLDEKGEARVSNIEQSGLCQLAFPRLDQGAWDPEPGAPQTEAQPPAPAKQNHWVEIELVGEDGVPIEGEEYWLTLPSGNVVRGYLDDNGWARVSSIDQAGPCRLTFPRLDQGAWKPGS